MLQRARSSKSKSFLREIVDALVLIENKKIKEYFLKKMQEVSLKREDTNTLFTGEKALKSEFLAYLKQLGYVRTANVWARGIPMDRKAIDELLFLLQQRLFKKSIQGVLELHLQDRNINSPHFQFVGIRCEEAESIIAYTLVELSYETSMQSALSKKNFVPYYEENPQERVQDLETSLEYYRKKRQEKEQDFNKFDEIVEETKALLRQLDEILKETKTLLRQFETIREGISETAQNSQEYISDLQSKSHHLKRLRMRIGRR